jgi:hypothetical protein
VGTANAEEVQHARLGFEDGAATDGTDFDGGHGDRDLEVAVVAIGEKVSVGEAGRLDWVDSLLHDGDAITALHILSRVLARRQEHRCDNVRSMRIESANTACHRAAD